ncbi:MAG TPA: galactose-1-phosphate uridylyltransferase [Terriglobia bacterium]|nr:galactose-1-phosphate uridylyltransferase [Terriglobia bacterium]
MTELRWNPTLREWVSTASHRQNRPLMPQDWCPFCPGSGRVPDNYAVYIYPNDFAAFSIPPEIPSIDGDSFYPVKPSRGKCDVVLYHPDHRTSLPELPLGHLTRLVRAWRKRFVELKATPGIRYVLIFENKGAAIGVTMPHPHGQIYAFPLIPPLIKKELDAARAHHRRRHRCLFCDILAKERADGRRIVAENDAFTAFVPFYARWPYEVHIYSRRHLNALDQFKPSEEKALAEILKWLTLKYDHLFQISFPYMMLMHQAPTRGRYPYYHFHIEFYPPLRSKKKLKYLASVESGAGMFLNDSLAEEKARELSATPPITRRELARSSRAPGGRG